ncbi:DMT family transporter [Pseudomonas kermanshahensis]|nr:DMT family transporter [Pseudomonas kermanshahensis]USS54374.1 DMT family transporter [Pseudomonas kermanshahensis]
MDILMGVVAALCWGATDFLVGLNARLFGVQRSVFLGQLLGLILLSTLLLVLGRQIDLLYEVKWQLLLTCLAAALLTVMGAVSLSRAFAQGKTAVVAPLVTSYGMFTTLLAWMGGEHITVIQWVGLVICASGVAIVGRGSGNNDPRQYRSAGTANFFALVAAALYGTSFWVQGKYTLPAIGPVNMLWISYLVGVVFLSPIMFKLKPADSPGLKGYCALCCASLFNLAGFTAFSYGALTGAVAIVTVISTMSGGIAAILGYLFYKDRLTLMQIAGVCLVLLGAVVLHFVA